MVDMKDIEKYDELRDMFSQVYAVEDGVRVDPCKDWVPEGTIEILNKDGTISWLDPILKRAMLFGDHAARNAWITLQRDKGVYKKVL